MHIITRKQVLARNEQFNARLSSSHRVCSAVSPVSRARIPASPFADLHRPLLGYYAPGSDSPASPAAQAAIAVWGE